MNYNDEKCCSKNDVINGITCDVKNCQYNSCDCKCTAGHITVGPSSADCCSDTVCATFKSKDK